MEKFKNHTDSELFDLIDEFKTSNYREKESLFRKESIRLYGNDDMICFQTSLILCDLAIELSKRYQKPVSLCQTYIK